MTALNPITPENKTGTRVLIGIIAITACLCVLAIGVGAGLMLSKNMAVSSQPTPSVPTMTASFTPPPTATATPTDTPTPTATSTFTPVPRQPLSKIIEALEPLRKNKGVPDAAVYDPERPGIHPLVVLAPDQAQQETWNNCLPESWQPANINQVELVAILTRKEVIIDRARYWKGSNIVVIERIRVDTEVKVLEATTGNEVASQVFQGGTPPKFTYTLPWGTRALYGTTVTCNTVSEWLRHFVEK